MLVKEYFSTKSSFHTNVLHITVTIPYNNLLYNCLCSCYLFTRDDGTSGEHDIKGDTLLLTDTFWYKNNFSRHVYNTMHLVHSLYFILYLFLSYSSCEN